MGGAAPVRICPPLISIVCPTIEGREEWLERCRLAYCETTPDAEFLIVHNAPTCNQGWNIGIPQARGEYIHLTADDIEPHRDWWVFAVEWVERGYLPAPRIVNPDGTLQSCGDGDWEQETGSHTELTRVPFFSRQQMESAGIFPIQPPGQYMGDAWVSHRGRVAGIPTVVVREMQFTHSFASVGRLDEMLYADVEEWKRLVRADGVRV